MVSIAAALARIKDDPDAVLGRRAIADACRAHVPGGTWRDTPLAPPEALALLIRQVAHGNCSCAELVRVAGGGFTAAGYCAARMRLPLAAVEACGRRVYDAAAARDPSSAGRWRGHRTWLVDGSGLSMPDAPALQAEFGQSGQQAAGCGFPVAHVLGLFDLRTGLVARMTVSPMRTHDTRHAASLHPAMAAGDVLLGDDAFGTYAHLALLLRAGLHGLFPVHHKRIVDFAPGRAHTTEGKGAVAGVPRARWVRSLGADDQVVEWLKPRERPDWVSADDYAALPGSITVRETRRTVRLDDGRRVTVTTVCTLTDAAAYPADALVELRGRRWQVEVDLRHLKTTMGMDVLRCKTVAGVNKEVAAFLLVYNLVQAIVGAAARRQRVDPARVSFADALYWARHAREGEELPRLRVNPHRPWRVEPRATKRRPKSYKLLNRPREELRQALLGKVVAT
jgi:hypothetical protein